MSKKTSKQVISNIKKQDIQMHSHAYFTVLAALTVISALLLMVLSALLIRMWLDDVSYIEKGELLHFGGPGRRSITYSFPWGLTLITILSVWFTAWLYKKFDVSHKQRLTTFYLGLGAALVLTVVIVGQSNAHEPFKRFTRLDRLETLKSHVEGNVIFGTLLQYQEESVVIEDTEGQVLTIGISNAVGAGLPKVGEKVSVIVEDKDSDELNAKGVRFSPGPIRQQVKSFRMK